jgi:hypothetical protein
MTDFPDRNLDLLRSRVASGLPGVEGSDRQLGALLNAAVARTIDAGGSLSLHRLSEGQGCSAVLSVNQVVRSGVGPTFAAALEDLLTKDTLDQSPAED